MKKYALGSLLSATPVAETAVPDMMATSQNK
ncbi:hypothetical protein EPYR_03305 [Erwinia pyrifoliae DSM 12163]|nr:hypothetical protein EPYR_03305 [Erwinia pyrifoliae DSM 12163]